MTQDHDFKALVRARMAKTGESYATARRQLRGEQRAEEDAAETTAPAPRGRGVLTLVAQGHVEVRGPLDRRQAARYDLHTPIGVEFARARFRQRAATRRRPRPSGALAEWGITLDGSQEVEAIEIEGSEITVRGEGHLAVQLATTLDLVVEADGHVFISDVAGDVEVVTPDGHVRLSGAFGNVEIETGDGHVVVDSLESGAIDTGDGNVTVALGSDDVTVVIEADHVSVDGPMEFTGTRGHWSGVVGEGRRDRLTITTPGRVGLAVVRVGEPAPS